MGSTSARDTQVTQDTGNTGRRVKPYMQDRSGVPEAERKENITSTLAHSPMRLQQEKKVYSNSREILEARVSAKGEVTRGYK